ncbi:hypothetical protein PG984_015845 [Apiospora sp. TS-2023a]
MSSPASDVSNAPSIRPSANPHVGLYADPSAEPSAIPLTAARVATIHEAFRKPQTITGGCLCGAVRYNVEFNKDHDFLKSSNSCQCTECRRQTGTLVHYTHTIPPDCLTWITKQVPLVPYPGYPVIMVSSTMRSHRTTTGYQLGFCQKCGSTLYSRDELRDDLQLALGTVDPEFLIGSYGEPGRAPNVTPVEPTDDGYGFALANCGGVNKFCDQEIKGVTDSIQKRGKRYFRNAPAEGRRKRMIEEDHAAQRAEEIRKQIMQQRQKQERQKGSEHPVPEETRAEVVVADAPVEAEQ